VFANGGFDAIIGNPPYIQLQKNGEVLGKIYENLGYKTFATTGDILLSVL
jgi:methylase of polypeptide subunit release factors